MPARRGRKINKKISFAAHQSILLILPLRLAAILSILSFLLSHCPRGLTMADVITLPAIPSHAFIAQFFNALRQNKSLFLVNPKIPNLPTITTAPPRSILLMTSGSTGTPKIAVLSFESLLANAESAIPFLDLRAGDKWRLTLPLYHVGGLGILLRCHLAGATVCLHDHPDITHLSYVPTHLYRASPVYKRLRCLLLGGAPISQPFPHFPIYTTYGLTEMSSMVTLNGQILPNREVKLAPDGEIFVKGPCLFTQYLNEEPITGWFATKDIGYFQDGKLEILGRKDWMFISGGENIQPEEIERHLLPLSVVIAARHCPEFGFRPVAITQTPCSLSDLHALLKDKLPRYKWPIDLYFVDEIPLKPNGKINRFILSQLVNNKSVTNISGQKKRPPL
jgi:acyl-CoA synthetase (AMP-forming)/AMP-acid ligase II